MATPRTKKLTTGIAILFLSILITLALFALRPKSSPQPAPRPTPTPVEVTYASPQATSIPIFSQAILEPQFHLPIQAQVSGQIISTHPDFWAGKKLEKGSTLATVDQRDYEFSLSNASAKVAQAEENVATQNSLAISAKKEWRELGDKNANDIFLRKPQVKAAKANLISAQDDHKKAKLALERTRISMPFTGYIEKTHADIGELVTAGTTIATIYNNDTGEISLPLKDTHINNLLSASFYQQGQNLHKNPINIPITLRRPGHNNQEWSAQLIAINPLRNKQSRLYAATAIVSQANNAHPLPLGSFVEAAIPSDTINNIIILPSTALIDNNQIFIVDENMAIKTHVEVLQRHQQRIWVRAAIADNTPVVTRNVNTLQNNEPVSITTSQTKEDQP